MARAVTRPHILFIHVDELRYPMHFPAGVNSVDEFFARFMPHLHRLLWKEGVKFSRHYTAAADCTAGRGTFVTGLYAQQTNLMVIRQGVGSGPSPQPPLQPEFPTYGKILREVGYDTPYMMAEASHSVREDDYLSRIRQIQRSWEKELQGIREDLQSKAREIEEIVVTPNAKNIEITKYLILWAAGL